MCRTGSDVASFAVPDCSKIALLATGFEGQRKMGMKNLVRDPDQCPMAAPSGGGCDPFWNKNTSGTSTAHASANNRNRST